MNDMENMRVFADQLWKYMVPKLKSMFASNVSYFRAQVVSNPGNNTLEVQRPVENGTLTLPCTTAMSGAEEGQQVTVLVMGSMSNAIIVGDGKLNVPGGGGDAGIANFQAQPDGSLVITLTNGTTFTATPHDPTKQDVLTFDDTPTANSNNPVKSSGIKSALDNKVDKVAGKGLSTNDYTTADKNKLAGIEAGAQVNQNAFANVKVGSTTVSADSEQDTLELVAGKNITITPDATNDKVTISTTAEVNQNAFSNVKVGSTTIAADNKKDTLTLVGDGLVTLTGNATNDSVTIYVDPNHTHDASYIVSGILPAARGGTGNGNGYIQIGQKAGTTLNSYATAEGYGNTASGAYCHSEGNNNTASGHSAHVEGNLNTASGNHSHSEGRETTASSFASHAEGLGTTASGSQSHAEGYHTNASDNSAHAEGYETTSSGFASHAEGVGTTASGDRSHAEGYHTTAAGNAQHVFGQYNTSNTTSVEIVGWGASGATKNIRTLSTAGNEWIAGTLTQASDARLKDVQGEIPDLSSVRAVRFRWKDGDDKEHLGYLAQDVEVIAPYLVDVDSNGYKSLDYIALLTAKVEMLEREIEKLKGR